MLFVIAAAVAFHVQHHVLLFLGEGLHDTFERVQVRPKLYNDVVYMK